MRLPKKFAQKSRKLFYFIHLWTGLILGLWLVVMGLTGSLLSWKYELIEWEARQRVSAPTPAPDAKIIPLSKAIDALKAVNPELGADRGIYLPNNPKGYYWLQARGEVNGERVSHIYLIHPVTAEVYPPVVGNSLWIDITEKFHHNLLVGVKGTVTNGFLTFFTLFLLASGVWLWWPSNLKQLKQRLTWKRGASLRRTLYDLHNVMGVYFYGLLFVVTLTGVLICYNGQTDQSIRKLVNQLAGVPEVEEAGARGGGAQRRPPASSVSVSEAPQGETRRPQLSIDEMVDKARAALPNNTLVSIRAPRRPGEPFEASYEFVRITRGGVPFDSYTGERLNSGGTAAFGRPLSPGTTFMGAVFHLHYGWFAGNWSKVLYCLSGFVPLGLFITGLWMWAKKKKAQQRGQQKGKLRKRAAKAQRKEKAQLKEEVATI